MNAIKDFPANPQIPVYVPRMRRAPVAIRFAVGNEQPGDEELVNCPDRLSPKTPAGIATMLTDPCGLRSTRQADDFFDYTEAAGVVTALLKSPGQYVPSGWILRASCRRTPGQRPVPAGHRGPSAARGERPLRRRQRHLGHAAR